MIQVEQVKATANSDKWASTDAVEKPLVCDIEVVQVVGSHDGSGAEVGKTTCTKT